ncbi:MAG: hypothetical protein RLZZ450_7417 [Pseudomonadota bacterium]
MRFSLMFLALSCALFACGGDEGEDPQGLAQNNADALATGMPCAVQPIVEKYCSTCHGKVPVAGAPMALVTSEDFQALAKNGEPYRARALARLHDTALPMPPAARPQPTTSERALLENWLFGGARRSSEACTGTVVPADALPPTIPDSECEMIVELRTHGAQTVDDTPFEVPPVDDLYECFYFPVPFMTKMHVLKLEPIVDNASVLHHYLLYQETTKVAQDGSHAHCGGTHPTAALLTGWAPGGPGASMPPDVGLQIAQGPEAQFNLEVHYNNTARVAKPGDRSGVRICATSKLRKNEAVAHWLGTELIFNAPGPGRASSECYPQQTAHIISVSPHMHRTGVHMKTEITRAGGAKEILTDRPFDFNDQQIYPVGGAAGEVIVGPGDSLSTVCDFNNDTGKLITFGSKTSQEMCYNFVVAWPAGALATGGGLLQGPNRCMQ